MGSLNFDIYKNTEKNAVTQHYFDDLHLDVQDKTITRADGTKGRDILIDFDDAAISNSLANIILTHPGERFLIPTFGCNLYQYLFTQVSEILAQQIGLAIKKAIEDFEPRVTVNSITVYALNDTQEYVIDMSIGIPLLSKNFNLVQKLKALDSYNL
jgi:phage baseplate assembly protein W